MRELAISELTQRRASPGISRRAPLRLVHTFERDSSVSSEESAVDWTEGGAAVRVCRAPCGRCGDGHATAEPLTAAASLNTFTKARSDDDRRRERGFSAFNGVRFGRTRASPGHQPDFGLKPRRQAVSGWSMGTRQKWRAAR